MRMVAGTELNRRHKHFQYALRLFPKSPAITRSRKNQSIRLQLIAMHFPKHPKNLARQRTVRYFVLLQLSIRSASIKNTRGHEQVAPICAATITNPRGLQLGVIMSNRP